MRIHGRQVDQRCCAAQAHACCICDRAHLLPTSGRTTKSEAWNTSDAAGTAAVSIASLAASTGTFAWRWLTVGPEWPVSVSAAAASFAGAAGGVPLSAATGFAAAVAVGAGCTLGVVFCAAVGLSVGGVSGPEFEPRPPCVGVVDESAEPAFMLSYKYEFIHADPSKRPVISCNVQAQQARHMQ